MTEKREFKINLEPIEAEDDFHNARLIKKAEKPQPVRYTPSLFVLFALMVLGITLVWMYYHFNAKLEAINTEGSSGIANLSSEFTDRITGMSQEIMDQKKAAQSSLSDLENQIAKVKSSIATLKAGKADAKEMDAAVTEIKKNVSPMKGALANLEKQLNEIDRKAENVAAGLKQLETNVAKNTNSINVLNENQTGRDYIDQQLKKERESYQQKLSASSESLLKEIASLETKISNMKQRLVSVENQLSRKSTSPGRTAPSSTYQSPVDGSRGSKPKPGEILEQDIR